MWIAVYYGKHSRYRRYGRECPFDFIFVYIWMIGVNVWMIGAKEKYRLECQVRVEANERARKSTACQEGSVAWTVGGACLSVGRLSSVFDMASGAARGCCKVSLIISQLSPAAIWF